MAVNWVEIAKKMAKGARAQVAADRKRLQEILAEQQRKQVSESPLRTHVPTTTTIHSDQVNV
jgi:hypothetical protein